MKEYIEREVVLKHKRKMSGADWSGEFWDEAVLCEVIRSIPAADVVEVVRCEKCEYRKRAKVIDGFLICPASGMEITDDAYCSYGERKGG